MAWPPPEPHEKGEERGEPHCCVDPGPPKWGPPHDTQSLVSSRDGMSSFTPGWLLAGAALRQRVTQGWARSSRGVAVAPWGASVARGVPLTHGLHS